jgi:hypothetical protein
MMASSVPRQLYQEHLDQNHPDFARWDKRMTLFLVPIIILVIASTLLFVGSFAGDTVGSSALPFGSLFALSLALLPIFALVQRRGKRRFQDTWNETHPIGALTGATPDSSFLKETEPSGVRSGVVSPEGYISALSLRLSEATFRVQREVRVDPYLFDLVAVRPAVQMGGFRDAVIVTTMDNPALDKVREFSALAMKYAVDNKSQLGLGSGDTLNLFPVIVSTSLSNEVKKEISDDQPEGSSMHGRTTLSILVAIYEQRTYYYTKTPIRGGLRYRSLRNFADAYLAPQSPTITNSSSSL